MTTVPLAAGGLSAGYHDKTVVEGVDVDIPAGRSTALIGPNGCGKSTRLATLARLLKPTAGSVVLEGRAIHELKTTEVARRLGLLPQAQTVPAGIRVADLVGRGRFAHQRFWSRWSAEDEQAVREAMDASGLAGLESASVDELSGGQRQRVWLATVLAQQTPLLLLDEPTTYLDIAHQFDVLRLTRTLQRQGRTIVMVLHDLNQAARFADNLLVMADGRIVAAGEPSSILTPELVEEVFGLPVEIVPDPVAGTPMVVPK